MHFPKLKRGHRGYVLILICICIPLILLGAKLVVDFSTQQTMTLKNFYKRCGNAAALEVAKKWNPGLSLSYQKESMLRIADDVYNRSPAHNDGHAMWEAIPGLDMELPTGMRQRGIYNPLEPTGTKIISMSPSVRTVPYQDVQMQFGRNNYGGAISVGEPYRRVYVLQKNPAIVLEEAVIDMLPYINTSNGNINVHSTYSLYIPNNQLFNSFRVRRNTTYTTRVNPSDNRVELAIENDRIKVSTDGHPGYAIPAECNVDIVLAIPTNMAACNKDNRDANTTTSGVPTIITTNTVTILDSATLAARTDVQNFRATPIYQIAQGLRRFLDENFKYTRGVNVGLIPYSGKLSIPPEKGDLWTEKFPSFNDSDASLNYIRSCFLYGTVGSKNTSLTTQYSAWGGYNCPERHGGYGIMMRGPLVPSANYGGNRYCVGDLLSTDDPATGNRFYRYNYRPCYGGYANLLSGKCEVNCTEYFYNPYFVVELTADVTKIYDLLNVFVPFNDQRNNSNFLFLPFVWANNLFQDWTKDPGCDAQDSSGSADGRLSCPSKKQADRKRAMILIVNKPDWFEPNELTYLGFDNDFSEIPTIESDCIRFDVNYSDTSRKFADGSSYNGTICGAKKILYYTTTSGTVRRNSDSGYYETSGSATGRLTFPKKHLIKIVVEPVMVWTNHGVKLRSNISGDRWGNWGRIDSDGTIFMLNSDKGAVNSSTDGVNWSLVSMMPTVSSADNRSNVLTYGDGKWVSPPYSAYNTVDISTDSGRSWSSYSYNCGRTDVSAYGNGLFLALVCQRGIVNSSYDGINWSQSSSFASIERDWNRALGFCNGCWMAITWSGKVIASYDNGKSWSVISDGAKSPGRVNGTTEWYGVNYIYNRYWIVRSEVAVLSSRDRINWTCEYKSSLLGRGLGFKGSTFVTRNDYGNVMTGTYQGTIQFKDISGMSNGVSSGTYTINDRKEFFIEPSQLSSNQLTFDMTNIRLISAEITNRPYTKVKPECRLSNSGNNAYITTNVRKPVRVKVDVVGNSSVRFNRVGDTYILYPNSGTHSITQTKSFTIPARDFERNWKLHKLSISLSNASVVSMSLANQRIRKDYYDVDEGGVICDKNLAEYNIYCPVKLKVPILFGSVYLQFYRMLFMSHFQNNVDIYCDRLVDKDTLVKLVSFPKTQNINAWTCFSIRIGSTDYTPGRCSHYNAPGSGEGYHVNMDLTDCPERRAIVSSLSETDKYLTVDLRGGGDARLKNFTFTNKDTVSLGKKTDANSIWVENDGVYFRGVGDLTVTVQPSKATGSLRYTNVNNQNIDLTIGCQQDIVISPDEYLFEQQSDGTYRVSLGLNNVSVSNPTMLDTDYTCVYAKPRLPEMSRTIEYRANPFQCNGTEIYNRQVGEFDKTWQYNSSFGCYVNINTSTTGYGLRTSYNDVIGDHFIITSASDPNSSAILYSKLLGNKTDSSGRRWLEYPFAGLHRCYVDYANSGTDYVYHPCAYTDFRNLPLKSMQLLFQGLTLPVNAALYSGSDGSSAHAYQWQSNGSGQVISYDTSVALKNLTKSACQKLKNDWAPRVYLIKYRKQTAYKRKNNGGTVSFDYSYLDSDSCADKVYDVSTEADLASRLKDIAEDIKNWAGYEPAKNVE